MLPKAAGRWQHFQVRKLKGNDVIYRGKDPNLMTVKWPTMFISCQ